MGNRIGKRERTATGLTFTWYFRDAQARQCLDLLFQQDLAIPVPIFYIGSCVTTTYSDSRGANFTALIRLSEHPIYGSSRLGSYQSGRIVYPRPENQGPYIYQPGLKQYELSNHLGNVLATVSDIKQGVDSDVVPDGSIDFERAVVKTQQSYYPFGMLQPEMSYTLGGSKYRFGFGGHENDNEVKGIGNSLDFGARIYDPRLGSWLSIDPQANSYPSYSPYVYCADNPIVYVDSDGETFTIYTTIQNNGKTEFYKVEFDGKNSVISQCTENWKDVIGEPQPYVREENALIFPFVEDVFKSYDYIVDNDADVDKAMQESAASSLNVDIFENTRQEGIYENGVIYFDFSNVTKITNRKTKEEVGNQSPALGFWSEVYHFYLDEVIHKHKRKEENYVHMIKESQVIDCLNENVPGNNEAKRPVSYKDAAPGCDADNVTDTDCE